MEEIFDRALIILRGLPGSGKSTLAKILSENNKYPVHSIDDYFINQDTGEYYFDYTKNHLAYKDCENKTEISLSKKISKVFLDNCFTMEWEIEPYFRLVSKYDYAIFVTTVENYHAGKNIHGISIEQLDKMAKKYKVKLMP